MWQHISEPLQVLLTTHLNLESGVPSSFPGSGGGGSGGGGGGGGADSESCSCVGSFSPTGWSSITSSPPSLPSLLPPFLWNFRAKLFRNFWRILSDALPVEENNTIVRGCMIDSWINWQHFSQWKGITTTRKMLYYDSGSAGKVFMNGEYARIWKVEVSYYLLLVWSNCKTCQ